MGERSDEPAWARGYVPTMHCAESTARRQCFDGVEATAAPIGPWEAPTRPYDIAWVRVRVRAPTAWIGWQQPWGPRPDGHGSVRFSPHLW